MQFLLIWPLIQLKRRTLLALGSEVLHSTARRWVWISWAAVRLWKEIIFCFGKKRWSAQTGKDAALTPESFIKYKAKNISFRGGMLCLPPQEGRSSCEVLTAPGTFRQHRLVQPHGTLLHLANITKVQTWGRADWWRRYGEMLCILPWNPG